MRANNDRTSVRSTLVKRSRTGRKASVRKVARNTLATSARNMLTRRHESPGATRAVSATEVVTIDMNNDPDGFPQ